MIVGLTGRYCAGKDAVARVFELRGFTVIDVDALGHEALTDRSREVIAAFGASVRAPDGGVDRKALGKIVFRDTTALRRLEGIVHPAMVNRVREMVARGGSVIVNAAILHRMGLHSLCDAIVCVEAPFFLRFIRAMRRDGLAPGAAWARLRSQEGICPQLNEAGVDTYTVRNRGSRRSLARRVARLALRLGGS